MFKIELSVLVTIVLVQISDAFAGALSLSHVEVLIHLSRTDVVVGIPALRGDVQDR